MSNNLYKDNLFVLIIQYIYINMFKKRFLYEQEEEEVELNDFQKILALNKKKISTYDVEFFNSEGNDFSDIITVDEDGLTFTFEGLEEYLRFFFPEEYGEEDSDGYYEAGYYDSMYRRSWTWDFDDRSYDDWREGFIVEALTSDHLQIIYDVAKIVQPGLLTAFNIRPDGKLQVFGGDGVDRVGAFLDKIDNRISDDITSSYVDAEVAAVEGEIEKYIEDAYCNCLGSIGIDNYSERHCFWKYKLHWGDAILLFVRFGTENDSLLDLLFLAISKERISHLPEYYEIQYNVWNDVAFHGSFDHNVDNDLESFKDRVLEGNNDGTLEKYFSVIDKINSTVGFDKYVKIPNSKVTLLIKSVDKETLKVKYVLRDPKTYNVKYGESYIDNVLNMVYNESLFDPMDYRLD
jgi:hypothetical protein